jgi:hypothetical protein
VERKRIDMQMQIMLQYYAIIWPNIHLYILKKKEKQILAKLKEKTLGIDKFTLIQKFCLKTYVRVGLIPD